MPTDPTPSAPSVESRVRDAVRLRHRQVTSAVARDRVPPLPHPNRPRRPLVVAVTGLATACVLAVAVVASVLALTRDQHDPEVPRVRTVAPEPPREVSWFWPDTPGLTEQIESIYDAPTSAPTRAPRWQQVYADTDGSRRIQVETSYGEPRPPMVGAPNQQPVQIGDADATLEQAPGSQLVAIWFSLPCGQVEISTVGLDRAAVIEAASSARCEARAGANDVATIAPPAGFTRRFDRTSPGYAATGSYTLMLRTTTGIQQVLVAMAPAESLDEVRLTSSAVGWRTLEDRGRTYGVLESEMTMNGVLSTTESLVYVDEGTSLHVTALVSMPEASLDDLLATARSLVRVDETTYRTNLAAVRASWDRGAYFMIDPVPVGFTVRVSESRSNAMVTVTAPATPALRYRNLSVGFRRGDVAMPTLPDRVPRPGVTPGGRAVQITSFTFPAPSPANDGSTVPGPGIVQVDWTDGDAVFTISGQFADDTEALLLDLVDRAVRVDHATFEVFRAAHAE